jgi:hypothetical protein
LTPASSRACRKRTAIDHPNIPAGARAVIAWLIEFDEGRIPETSGEYLRTLLRAPLLA